MTNLFVSRAHCACLALALPIVLVSAPANAARQQAVLTYFLPKTVVSASVSQELLSCQSNDKVVVGTNWMLRAAAEPDYSMPILVDASTGFLAKRSVALTLNPDGTIHAFNSESAGQGGAVVASLLKFAGVVAPVLAGASPAAMMTESSPWVAHVQGVLPSPCTDETQNLLRLRSEAEEMIANLEAFVASGEANPPQLRLLAAKQEELSALKAKLTISSAKAVRFDPAELGPKRVVQLNYAPWFGKKPTPPTIPGASSGFCLDWAASEDARKSLRGDGTIVSPNNAKPARQMVYRRPVPAVLLAGPATSYSDSGQCTIDSSADSTAASNSLDFSAPQLSGYYSVPIGSGGIFGSREVKASFDSFGAPLNLSYSSDPNAAAIAGTIDAAGESVSALHNAEVNALTHEISIREKRQQLEELRKPKS